MPHYTMQDQETLETVEVYFPAADAPDWGKVIYAAGRRLVRVMEAPVPLVDNGGPSFSAPRWDPLAPRHDKKGRPQFNNRREARDFAKKKNDKPDHLSYDLD